MEIQGFSGSAFGTHVWSEAGKQNGERESEISGSVSSEAFASSNKQPFPFPDSMSQPGSKANAFVLYT